MASSDEDLIQASQAVEDLYQLENNSDDNEVVEASQQIEELMEAENFNFEEGKSYLHCLHYPLESQILWLIFEQFMHAHVNGFFNNSHSRGSGSVGWAEGLRAGQI